MTQYQLTLDPTVLQRLFTSSDGQLAHLLEAILNQVLEAQMAEQLQAQRYERTDERLHAIFEAPDEATTRLMLARFVADYSQTAPSAVATLERGFDDATAALALPAA